MGIKDATLCAGNANDKKMTFLSLGDALKQNKVVVEETNENNRLVIKNTSSEYVSSRDAAKPRTSFGLATVRMNDQPSTSGIL